MNYLILVGSVVMSISLANFTPVEPAVIVPFSHTEVFPRQPIAVSSNGKLLATFCWDIWDIDRKVKLVSGKTHGAHGINFSPDGKLLVVAGNYSEFFVYHTRNGEVYWNLTLKGHGDTVLQDVEFTADGKYLLSFSHNGVFRVWEVASKTPYAFYHFACTREYAKASYDNCLRPWRALAGDAPPDNVKQFVEFPNEISWPGAFSTSPIDTRVAIPTHKSEVLILNWKTGKIEQTLKTRQPATISVAYSKDGKQLAIGGGDSKPDRGTCSIEIWDTATNKRIQKLSGHRHSVLRMAFSPDGKTLASGGLIDGVRVWDLASGKEKYPPLDVYESDFGGVRNVGLAFLPDNKTLLTLPELFHVEPVHFWDSTTGKRIPQTAP